ARHLPINIELKLIGGRVAHTDRLGALIAGQPGELELGEPATPAKIVHDLYLAGRAGRRAQEPIAESDGLVEVAAEGQRHDGQAGVAQPAEAIVPVAHAPQLLRQRRRRRGDDATSGRVGERLERDERTDDSLPPAALVGAATGPIEPELLG